MPSPRDTALDELVIAIAESVVDEWLTDAVAEDGSDKPPTEVNDDEHHRDAPNRRKQRKRNVRSRRT